MVGHLKNLVSFIRKKKEKRKERSRPVAEKKKQPVKNRMRYSNTREGQQIIGSYTSQSGQ